MTRVERVAGVCLPRLLIGGLAGAALAAELGMAVLFER